MSLRRKRRRGERPAFDREDTRSPSMREAANVIAKAFSGAGAVRFPPGFGGGKDPHRSPVSLRFQAGVREGLRLARIERLGLRLRTDEAAR